MSLAKGPTWFHVCAGKDTGSLDIRRAADHSYCIHLRVHVAGAQERFAGQNVCLQRLSGGLKPGSARPWKHANAHAAKHSDGDLKAYMIMSPCLKKEGDVQDHKAVSLSIALF